MKNPPIKFRVWDKKAKHWLDNADYCIFQGEVIKLNHDITDEGWSELSLDHYHGIISQEKNLVIQRFTGLKDKNKKEIFEGDIVKFNYSVGDFAWEQMDEKEILRQHQLLGQEYVCQVTQEYSGINLRLVRGNPTSTCMIFPLLYISTGKMVGNIFQNADLLK